MRVKIGGMKIAKGVLAKVREAGVGPEEIDTVTAFCEETNQGLYRLGYLGSEDGRKEEDARIIRIRELEAEEAKAEFEQERELFRQTITDLQDFIKRDEKRVSLFRWLTAMLPEREKLVLRRLYEEGFPWSRVYDYDGTHLKPGSVQCGRNNGLALMALEISKHSMWAEINALKGEENE